MTPFQYRSASPMIRVIVRQAGPLVLSIFFDALKNSVVAPNGAAARSASPLVKALFGLNQVFASRQAVNRTRSCSSGVVSIAVAIGLYPCR